MNISMSGILHMIGQALLNPCLIVLILLMVATVWQVGDLLMEYLTERRKFKVDAPVLLRHIPGKTEEELAALIEESGLLPRQKKLLNTLLEAREMPKASLVALAQQLVAQEEERLEKYTAVTDLIARLGPMFGLLGTLIPLGPGIVALGQGDTQTLAESLGVAFDTTIAGVISAAVSCVISNIRKRWYNEYITLLESTMECILEEMEKSC